MEVEKKMYKKKTMYIRLDDGVFVIDEDYITESKSIRYFYRSRYHGALPVPIKGISSRIVRKALQFSKQRGLIKKQHNNDINDDDDDDDNDDNLLLLQQKLKAFDHNFLQQNLDEAFDLADVACRLQMKSLFYLMRNAATDMIAHKTPEDIRKSLDLYYDENKTNAHSFERMKYEIGTRTWVFKPIM